MGSQSFSQFLKTILLRHFTLSQVNAAVIAAKRDIVGGPRPQEISELQFSASGGATTTLSRVRLRHSQGKWNSENATDFSSTNRAESRVRECLGFGTTDFWFSLAYESAEQKPKHWLTWDFSSALSTSVLSALFPIPTWLNSVELSSVFCTADPAILYYIGWRPLLYELITLIAQLLFQVRQNVVLDQMDHPVL